MLALTLPVYPRRCASSTRPWTWSALARVPKTPYSLYTHVHEYQDRVRTFTRAHGRTPRRRSSIQSDILVVFEGLDGRNNALNQRNIQRLSAPSDGYQTIMYIPHDPGHCPPLDRSSTPTLTKGGIRDTSNGGGRSFVCFWVSVELKSSPRGCCTPSKTSGER